MRQLVLVTLAAAFVAVAVLAVRAGTGSDDESADGDGSRIEAVGDRPSAERSSGPSDGEAPAPAQGRSVTLVSPDDQAGLAIRLPDASAGGGTSTEAGGASPSKTAATPMPSTTDRALTTTTQPSTTTTAPTTSGPTTIPPVGLTNGGFDSVAVPAGGYQLLENGQVPGWTSDTGVFEVWHRDMEEVGSSDGSYLLELNATSASTIYQDFATTPGTEVRWTFSHRGRDGKDEMELLMGPSDGKLKSIKDVKTGREWKTYSGTYKVPEGQTSTRIAFRALESGSVGNLLDAVQVSLKS